MPKQQNLVETYLSKWVPSSDTYITMKRSLDRIAKVLGGKSAETFAWHKFTPDVARGIGAKLTDEGLAPRSVNKILTALRGLLEVAWRGGQVSDEVYRKIKIEPVRGTGKTVGRALKPEETDKIAHCLHEAHARDAALIAVLLGAGLRRVEATKLRAKDYDRKSGRLTAKGKGNKTREIPVGDRWRYFVEAWIADKKPNDVLFDITRRQISLVIERFCDENEIVRFTPHDLRKTFGTHICKVADIAIAQRLLGHAHIQTTATIYDRRDETFENEAVKDL